MKKQITLFFLQLFIAVSAFKASAQSEPFSKRTIISGLNHAWEVVYGPHDSLWITEDKDYTVSRISLGATPVKTTLLDLVATGNKTFPNTGAQPQGGLMGLAIHPNLYSTNAATRAAKPWVYIAYVYGRTTTPCPDPGPACFFNTRIVRYEYNGNALINPVTVVDGLPGSSDHNSGRLVISLVPETGPDPAHLQYALYYSIGDMGAGQLTNSTRTNNAQNQNVTEGKILRLNTEPDGDLDALDRWVPDDNPFYDGTPITAKEYVFSMGHRNPQGLAWGLINGVYRLYGSEQSDRADDEVNLIESGKNYGWDMVSGKCDGDVNTFKIGGRTIVNEVTNCVGTTQPIFTTFHHNTTYASYPPAGSPNANWPTMASTSISFYGSNFIPGWKGSLFVTPLKENRVYRLKLNAAGTAITGDTISYFRGDGNRIRRITSDLTGQKFYVARDAGTIMEYTYTGVTLPLRLLSFTGELQNNTTLLQWETADETNTSSFEIERSADGVVFDRIGTVAATGNSNTSLKYSYKDNEAGNQPGNVIYYRLKMVDIDGDHKYSGVITISIAAIAGRITLIPNPAGAVTTLNITSFINGTAKWNVSDNTGRIVLQGNLQLRSGNNTTSIGLQKLTAGLYYLTVSGSVAERKIKFQKL